MSGIYADLHMHTVLSPCGDLLMTPQNIIKQALGVGLDIIAITDHNSAENVEVAIKLAKDTPLTVIPGMEVTTSEEVHLVCLFANLKQVLQLQEIVYKALPNIKNKEEVFGPQIIVNSNDQYVKKLDRLLLTATDLTVKQVIKEVRKLGGLVIPAHIDKKNYSLISNLGFIPPDLNLSIVEIYSKVDLEEIKLKFPQLENYFLITSSDAHYLEDIAKSIKLRLNSKKLSKLKKVISINEESKKLKDI
ncbi:putative metal-dependent phosphoesterase, PHP family [Halobacteroides halobius DSM 5150]|uniref:Putative metal-dependent phosphoesterase, PHP family n=1 Tax=Halobacteroides halobius (strain ATCC 35273 / DSM 5150 / MD-1) TaxID=748449 RepID=L0KA86_HALHC|nr:PHP domain-containing protein [Halobacteroides halobius]AGB41911.1 putative metal-dependent phosphoesterase, PHP family [Halobacteroides halobius DSM 5150]